MSSERCRFAPTTSGPAHPGTLLAALLCWLDARSRGASITLRLEDADATRCTPQSAQDMRDALFWFGLDWDDDSLQSERHVEHAAALDTLAADGRLYPCRCSRSEIRRSGVRAADGGWRYPSTCSDRTLPAGGWRDVDGAVRLRLASERIEVADESDLELSQDPALEMGDPILRRRDGTFAYHLACVVDDGAAGITRIVRGRDLAVSTAIQVQLQRALGLPTPIYRHHFLLLERDGDKFAKLHGAVGWRELARHYTASQLCGVLAGLAGLADSDAPTRPRDLIDRFGWSSVRGEDEPVEWTGRELRPWRPPEREAAH